MTRRKKDPLRTLTEEEKTWLERISRSQSELVDECDFASVGQRTDP